LFAVSSARESGAAVITFDQAIGGSGLADDPNDDFDNCVVYCAYDVFTTQGFRFTAQPNFGPGDEGEGVVVNPAALAGIADNGTDYLLAGGIVVMTRADNAAFSLVSIQAANIFPDDDTVGTILRVFAFKNNAPFQLLQFNVNAAFQEFVLPDTWTGLSAVNISGRFAADNNQNPRILAVDNITVPEPASLLLLGMGALGLVARARQRRAVRP
jgi:hypothetical protein